MYIVSLTLIVFTILLGCSTASKQSSTVKAEFRPPEVADWPINDQLMGEKDFESIDLFLNRVAKENPDQRTTWWVDYRRAQLWSTKNKTIACENFSRLAGEANFPIRRLAYLHAHEVCPKENQILTRLETFDLDRFDPWLAGLALDVAILRGEQNKERALLTELYLKKSKVLTRREEKIEFADKALALTSPLTDKNKTKEIESRIYNLSPSRKPNPPFKEYLSVANDFKYLRKFDQALSYFTKILKFKKSSPFEKLQALRGIRATYKVQQKKNEALKATEDLANFVAKSFKASRKDTHDAKLYADTHLLLARTYWTEQQTSRAYKLLESIVTTVADKTSLAEVYWMLGRMEEEKQDYKKANTWFQQALNQTIESPVFRDKLNWYLAWNLRKDNQFAAAAEILKGLKQRAESPFEKGKFTFWLGKTFAQNKKNSEARDEWQDLIKEDSLGYYGLLAHRELNEPIPLNQLRNNKSDEEGLNLTRALRPLVDENYFMWLVATHETDVTENYLDEVASQLKKDKGNDVKSWAILLSLYAKSQNYLGLFNQLNTLEVSLRRKMLEENPKLIFPNPYFETVTQAAGRFGISPEFIYSIMRQESSFNPQARSPMDAFGLMQLLPQVAKKSAEANSIDYSQTEDLYSPHINIPIGSAHLRDLWDKYNGEVILAAASYNASESAILSWLKTRFRGDTLEFIEDIPYDETRDYVKLVLRNLVTYQIINAQEDRFNFPEWTLKIYGDNSAKDK